MDIFAIVISPKARLDIENILDFVRADSEQGAGLISDKFEQAINSLNILPRRHPVYDLRRDSAMSTYGMVVYSYIVYYRVDDAGKTVRLISVIHGARRQPRRFK